MSQRTFHFSVTAILLTLIVAGLLARLGFWQLDRAAQKREQIASFDQGASAPVAFNELMGEPQRYRHLSARGHFISGQQVVMDGISKNNAPGYLVLTPFKIQGSDTILMVNRGWRRWSGSRDQIDGLEVDDQAREISGRVDRFWQSGMVLGRGNEEEDVQWPRIVVYPQHAEIERWMQAPTLSWQMLLDPELSDGFVRDWRPAGLKPRRNVGYAVQWFAMSLTVVIIYFVLSFKKTPRRDETT